MERKARLVFFFFQAEDGIRDLYVTGVQTCALPICERQKRWVTERPADGAQLVVVRAKVLPPPVDAVRFVDHQVGRPCAGDLLYFGLTYHSGIEPLWGAIQELDGAIPQEPVPNALFLRAEIAVDECSRDLLRLKVGHLLAHERLQRRDHEPAAAAQKDRHLKAERLARAGGTHEEKRLASEGSENHLKLVSA